jgi:peroxin-13
MLESTFFATQSSFHAMVGVAEQMGTAKSYLSKAFSLVSIYTFFKKFISRITGRPMAVSETELTIDAFDCFQNNPKTPSINVRPLLFFIVMSVGIPWLMSKLINNSKVSNNSIDPKNVDFAKVKTEFEASVPGDLSLKINDIVAILSKNDPNTNNPSEWWQGRTQDGRIGALLIYFRDFSRFFC